MNTTFEIVYNTFLTKVSDYNLLELETDEQEEFLFGLMKNACTKFALYTGNNKFLDFDVDNEEFNSELTLIENDIITECMIAEWLKPIVMNSEAMKNRLKSEYSLFDPHNLLNSTKGLLENAEKASNKMMIIYTYKNGNISSVKVGDDE